MLRALLVFVLLLCAACMAQGQASMGGAYPKEDQVCVECHADMATYAHTAHRATSSAASAALLQPLVSAAGQKLTISGDPLPMLAFIMNAKGGSLSETAETGTGTETLRRTEPIDVVVGSDKRGQTFLSWSGNRLFELPVSYWKQGTRWINSPGYIDGTADFGRPVQPGCLECHATSAVALSPDPTANVYQRDSLVFGIGCRTCHGDGAAHVTAERAAKTAGQGKAEMSQILNPAHFSRDRQIDLCALCHSGIQRSALKPAFSYVPGQPLASFFHADAVPEDAKPDVHGNQVGLLEKSRCFRGSQMTCSTCHNVHSQGPGLEVYAARCQTCHKLQDCGESRHLGAAIQTRCVECHMPVQQTEAIVSTTAGERIQASMRTHWIKVY